MVISLEMLHLGNEPDNTLEFGSDAHLLISVVELFTVFCREKLFKQSLSNLKVEVVKANSLVREANYLAQEMSKQTEFHVTLQIPSANLTPNRKVQRFSQTSVFS